MIPSGMTPEQFERSLVSAGVNPDFARARRRQAEAQLESVEKRPVLVIDEAAEIQWPLSLVLPWSHLISDDRKYAPALNREGKPVMLLTEGYRRAKGLTRDRARQVLGIPAPAPAAIPLQLEAAVWVPDNRIHDPVNFAKCAHDALEEVVYRKDAWLWDTRWYRAGVDVDAPRAELTIRPISQ